MSYVTSPFEVLTILFILSVIASFGVTTMLNKWVYDFPTKWDIVIGAVLTVVIFVATARAIF